MVEKSLLLGVPSSMTSGTASTRNKRILRELRQYQNDPHPSVDVYPNEDKWVYSNLIFMTLIVIKLIIAVWQYGSCHSLDQIIHLMKKVKYLDTNIQERLCTLVWG